MTRHRLKDLVYDWLVDLKNRSYRPCLSCDKDLKIFVIAHNDKDLPRPFSDGTIYRELRVGNALKKTALNDVLTDDVGENISAYNLLLNEMTGIYWVAKHYSEVGNPDYVGFNHYRRQLQWAPRLLQKNHLVATSRICRRRIGLELAICGREDLMRLFRKKFTEAFKNTEFVDYDHYWNSHVIYYSNLFITDRATFFRYFSFIEKCIRLCLEMIKRGEIDLSSMSPYYKRVYSFFLEHMTSYWIYHSARYKKIVLHTARVNYFDIPNFETSVH